MSTVTAIFGFTEQQCDVLADLTLGLFGIRPSRDLAYRSLRAGRTVFGRIAQEVDGLADFPLHTLVAGNIGEPIPKAR